MAEELLGRKGIAEDRIRRICRIIEHYATHAPEAEGIEDKIASNADRPTTG